MFTGRYSPRTPLAIVGLLLVLLLAAGLPPLLPASVRADQMALVPPFAAPSAGVDLTSRVFHAVGRTVSDPFVWRNISPEGGVINALAIDPHTPATLYAGAGGGVYKSANGGASWSPANTGLPSASISALAIDPLTPTTLYTGAGGGVYKSANGGASWSPANTGLTNAGVEMLLVDPLTPTTLYALTGNTPYNFLYKSMNGGADWTAINPGAEPYFPVSTLAIAPLTPTTLYAGVFRPGLKPVWSAAMKSTDGGVRWMQIHSWVNDVEALLVDPQTPTTLYAGIGRDGGVYRSTDGGSHWTLTPIPGSTSISALVLDSLAPTTLYAGTAGGVYKSTDGGESWAAINTGLSNLTITVLAIDPVTPAMVYAGTAGGLFVLHQASSMAYLPLLAR